jgi:hypothetical protein
LKRNFRVREKESEIRSDLSEEKVDYTGVRMWSGLVCCDCAKNHNSYVFKRKNKNSLTVISKIKNKNSLTVISRFKNLRLPFLGNTERYSYFT